MGKIYTALIGENTRAFLAYTTDMAEQARVTHGTSPVATAALGKTLTAASIMGKMLKSEREKLTFQIKGSNLIKSITAVAWENGNVKAYISNPDVHIDKKEDGRLNVGDAIGEGEMVIIRDLGLKEPYVGQSKLVTGEIAEDLATYYLQSEQQPSVVALGFQLNDDASVKASGGIIVQTLPDVTETEIVELEYAIIKMGSFSDHLASGQEGEALLNTIFEDLDVRITGEYDIELKCDCSKDRLREALKTIGSHELTDIIEHDKQAELHCHFCNTYYMFNEAELNDILKEILEK